MNDSVIKRNHRDQTQFSPEKKILEDSSNDIQFPGLHIIQYYNIYDTVIREADLRGPRGHAPSLFFAITCCCFFYNPFGELTTLLFEV